MDTNNPEPKPDSAKEKREITGARAPINRYGTFLWQKHSTDESFLSTLGNILAKAVVREDLDEETKVIVKQLHADFLEKGLSKNIQEEGLTQKFSLSPQESEWLFRHDSAQWLDYLIYRFQFKTYPRSRKL